MATKGRQVPPVIYSGKVGAKMRPVPGRTKKRPVLRALFVCEGGPLDKKHIKLELGSGHPVVTLTIRVRGQVGRYVNGVWEPKLKKGNES